MRILKTALIALTALAFASACVLLPAILANNSDSARVGAFAYSATTPAPVTELRALRAATVEALSKLPLQNTDSSFLNETSAVTPYIQSDDMYIGADVTTGASKTSLSRLESLILQCGYGEEATIFEYATKSFAEISIPDSDPDANLFLQYSEEWGSDTRDWSNSYYMLVDGYSGRPILFTTRPVDYGFIYVLRENLTNLSDSQPEIMMDAYALLDKNRSETWGQAETAYAIDEGDVASLLLAPDGMSLSYALSQSDEYLAALLGLGMDDEYYSKALEVYVNYASPALKSPDDAPDIAAKLANALSSMDEGAALAEQIYYRLDVLYSQGEDALREIRGMYTSTDLHEAVENVAMPTAASNPEFEAEIESPAADTDAELVSGADYDTNTSASSVKREAALKFDASALSYNEMLAYCTLYTPELSSAIHECAVAAIETYPGYGWLDYTLVDGCAQLPQESLLGWAGCTLDTSVPPVFHLSANEDWVIARYYSLERTFGVDVVFDKYGAMMIYLVINDAR